MKEITHSNQKIHLGPILSATREAKTAWTWNPIGASAPRLEKAIVRCRPGSYCLLKRAIEFGTTKAAPIPASARRILKTMEEETKPSPRLKAKRRK